MHIYKMKNNLILQHNALNSIKNAIEKNKKDINNQILNISNLAKRNKYLQPTINHIGGYNKHIKEKNTAIKQNLNNLFNYLENNKLQEGGNTQIARINFAQQNIFRELNNL